MQRDVAAIVDIKAGGALVRRKPGKHGGEHFVGHRPGHGRHRRDEMFGGKRQHGMVHAPGNRTLGNRRGCGHRHFQQRQFADQFIEHALKAPAGHREGMGAQGGFPLRRGCAVSTSVKTYNEIDGAVLQMQPAVRMSIEIGRDGSRHAVSALRRPI